MNDLIIEKSDVLHDTIFEISETAIDLKFPISRVISFLEEEGFILSYVESSKNSAILYRGEEKTVVGEKFVAFETLTSTEKEKHKQNLYKFLILRYKIFYQSALQNTKAAKINLIQNQRRTCVSNMYYSLHNSFASMVEYYKAELSDNEKLLEPESDYDDETKLEHFIPRGLKVFTENIDEIIILNKEEIIMNEKMNTGRVKSYENPFTWIIPLFYDLTSTDEFVDIVESMYEAIEKINLENYAVDETMRRSQFEQQLKENLTITKELIKAEDCSPDKKVFLVIAAFLAYGYMLRQSADYDSLFEIKIPHQDIINWTIITSNFLSIVTSFIKEESTQATERVQKLDAASSTEILQSSDTDVMSSIMTMTGIIIDKSFDLKNAVKELNSKKGYSMINQRGEISILSQETDNTCIRRMIFSTPLECFISFSKQGLFRIDVTLTETKLDSDFYKGINQFYLEQLIEKDVIERDLLQIVSANATIVRGIPTTVQFNSVNYLDLVVGVHERLKFNLLSIIRRHLEKLSEEKKNEDLIIDCSFYMNKQGLMRGMNFLQRRSLFENIETRKVSKILIVKFYSINEELSDSENVRTITHILKDLEDRFPENNYFIELISLSDYENRQLVEKNYSFFNSTLENLIEKYEKYTSIVPDFIEEEKSNGVFQDNVLSEDE